MFEFSRKKTGFLQTPHGGVRTPNFIFCATKGTIKGLANFFIPTTQMILCNTFHLQEYAEKIQSLGGIHKFTGFDVPIVTDSGGFQIFSMGHGSVASEIKGQRYRDNQVLKITEEGCYFNSPLNGNKKFLSPEVATEIQIKLGVDFAVAFDECTPSHGGYDYTKQSTLRSIRWEQRSLEYFQKNAGENQKMIGIVQGGVYKDLRDTCLEYINNSDFFGVAIGGSLGQTKDEMYDVVKYCSRNLRGGKFIHLLGIGKVEDIWALAPYVDSFDCVEPTRIGRHGIALVRGGRINLRNAKHWGDPSPLCSQCSCFVCMKYSRSYINYLLKVRESAGPSMLIHHNMHFMNTMMEEMRQSLENNQYEEVQKKWV
jgi:queuine tRNA-ribosyltransferase